MPKSKLLLITHAHEIQSKPTELIFSWKNVRDLTIHSRGVIVPNQISCNMIVQNVKIIQIKKHCA